MKKFLGWLITICLAILAAAFLASMLSPYADKVTKKSMENYPWLFSFVGDNILWLLLIIIGSIITLIAIGITKKRKKNRSIARDTEPIELNNDYSPIPR